MPTLNPSMPAWLRFLTPRPSCGEDDKRWLRDPLSHPTIAGMSAEQVADLPAAERRARLRC